MKMLMIYLIAISVVTASLPAPLQAAELAGVAVPETIEVNGTPLVLNGLGLRTATIFGIKVYVGALYLEQKSSDPRSIASGREAKQIQMHFLRDVDKDKLNDAWREGVEANAPNPKEVEAPLDQFCLLMEDVEEGSQIILTAVEDTLSISINGQNKGEIKDPKFVEALFLVWLGENPPNSALKKGMLGL